MIRAVLTALLFSATLSSQAPLLPQVVSPFPSGLSGTLAFSSDLRTPDNPDGRNHIFTIDLAAGRVTQLTSGRNHHDQSPRWSPDGRRIAFASSRGSNFDIYVMDADGRNVTRLTEHAASDMDPFWMPDMQSLIFSSDRDSRSDLYRVWIADRRVDRLTHHFVGRAIMPNVSPDGKSVAFAAQTLQRLQFWSYQVHVLDLATGRTRAIDGTACWPNWSPDGRLANVLLEKEPSRLQVRNADGGAARELAADPKRWAYYPDWSKDGRLLAFSVSPAHHEGEDWDLALIPADGSRPVQKLTTGPGNDRQPDWKP
ncbi:MAG TPA: DPP IV N-terminal domain-containing protein [Vicinamibacterales bacterium]|nr:DPP IV N-terminal domain-containing protein [Vicinamibacterales bacterium]